MPIVPPRLDDRRYEDLIEELLARVPAHTPEWRPQEIGDPGRTLLELFAWLGDTLLYRANLIPERQRLAFLQLLGMPLRPARPARGLIGLRLGEANPREALTLRREARVSGPQDFETLDEVQVMPVSGECYYKRRLDEEERHELAGLIAGLRQFHEIDGEVEAYVTTPAFVDGRPEPDGLDLVADTADRSLWIALLAASPAEVSATREALAGQGQGGGILNLGIAPTIEFPDSLDDLDPPGRLDHGWWISTDRLAGDEPVYRPLQRLADSTADYTRRGVERLAMPGDSADFGVLEGDARREANAGVGDRPPRLDDPERLARLVAWLRLRPADSLTRLSLSWVAVNAVEIDQRRTLRDLIVGQSDGSADQVIRLPVEGVQAEGLELQVEEPGRGFVTWTRVDDLALAGRDDEVFQLDAEAGTVRFGDSIRGRVPDAGQRIRVARLRAGGGAAGNLPPDSLRVIEALEADGRPVRRKLVVSQGLATTGGADAERLDDAQRRIPAWLRHRQRAVTEDDYRALVADMPGLAAGRVEVLPRFLPRQRRFDVPGVVSVMVLPRKALPEAPNPRPDQPMIQRVHDYLSVRRPLATELYVIGCEYVPLALGVGLRVRAGFGHQQVIHDVREALRRHLWSLPPHGPQGEGWPLGGRVRDRELEVVVARVSGVASVGGISLFRRQAGAWRRLGRQEDACEPVEMALDPWQLPELLAVSVSDSGEAPGEMGGDGLGKGTRGGEAHREVVALPVVPEIC